MVKFRAILAGLIALAVAVAPVAATLLASAGARAATVAVAHDCHGTAQHDGRNPYVHSDKAGCPDCQDQDYAKCIGDGGKCCKLTAMLAFLPAALPPVEAVDAAANLPMLIGWKIRPPPPPPRA